MCELISRSGRVESGNICIFNLANVRPNCLPEILCSLTPTSHPGEEESAYVQDFPTPATI